MSSHAALFYRAAEDPQVMLACELVNPAALTVQTVLDITGLSEILCT